MTKVIFSLLALLVWKASLAQQDSVYARDMPEKDRKRLQETIDSLLYLNYILEDSIKRQQAEIAQKDALIEQLKKDSITSPTTAYNRKNSDMPAYGGPALPESGEPPVALNPPPYPPGAGRLALEAEMIADMKNDIETQLSANPPSAANQLGLFNNYFDTYVVDLRVNMLEVFWKDRRNIKYYSLGALREDLKYSGKQLLFATNGGMFNLDFEPQGLLAQNGRVVKRVNTKRKGYGNFYLQPNGIFLLDSLNKPHIIPTNAYLEYRSLIRYATQSGPMLLYNGIINKNFRANSNNYRLRSGVGIIDNHRIVFIISKNPVTFYNFARIFKEVFACQNALFLDGEISKMYCPELSRFDAGGRFASIIGVVK